MRPHLETLYVRLLSEGPDAWRPVLAARRADNLFEILSTNDDPELELWQFPPGSLVRGELRTLSDGPHWVAIELRPAPAPRLVKE